MDAVVAKLQRISLEFVCADLEAILFELRCVPSSALQNFCRFALTLNSADRLGLFRGLYAFVTQSEAPEFRIDRNLAKSYIETETDRACPWEQMPIGKRMTLQLLLEKTGKIPVQFLSPDNGVTVEAIRASAPIRSPSANALKTFLGKEFGASRYWKEPDGAIIYQVSEKHSIGAFSTLVGYSHGGKLITCFHQHVDEGGKPRQFFIFPYALQSSAMLLDLVDATTLETLRNPLHRIIDRFETIVEQL